MKMAVMVADRGLVFWHDYGGKVRFRHLTAYLDALAGRIPIYRVPSTTLAWTSGDQLHTLVAEPESGRLKSDHPCLRAHQRRRDVT